MMKKWLSKIKFNVVLLVLGMSWAVQADVPLTQLKNSFAGLKTEFQHLSPLHGAVGWISEYTKNIYKLDDKTKVHALAASLFHALPGGEIVASNAPNRAATYLTPEMVGTIIGMLESEKIEFEKQEQEALRAKKREQKNNIIIKEESSSKKRKRDAQDNTPEESNKKIKLEKNNQKTQAKKVVQKKKISQEDVLIAALTPLVLEQAKKSGKKFSDKNIKSDLRKLTTNLCEALKECKNVESGYPQNAPIIVMLSFLHIISTGKQDLNAYYQGLESKLGAIRIATEHANNNNNNIIIIDESDSSHNNITDLDYHAPSNNIIDLAQNNNQAGDSYKYSELVQELERLRDAVLWSGFFNGLHGASYEKTVLALLSGAGIGIMPPKIEYCKNSQFESVRFPNCLENTMRYLINVLLYNDETELFDFGTLTTNSPDLVSNQFDQQFTNFFEKTFGAGNYQYSALSTQDANKQEVHDAWNQVVCNRDWCCYGKIVAQNGEVYEVAPRLSARGFLKLSLDDFQNIDQLFPECTRENYLVNNVVLDGIYTIKFQNTGHTYLVFDPEKFKAFDLAPSIKNMIIMLDQLLGLGIIGDLKATFDTADFNAKFWPLLCDKLNITCEDAYQEDLKETPKCLSNIDAWDYTPQLIKLNVAFKADKTGKKKFSFFCQGPDARYLAHSDYSLLRSKDCGLKGLHHNGLKQFLNDGWNNSSALSLASALFINAPEFVCKMIDKPSTFYRLKHRSVDYSYERLRVIKSILICDKAPHVSIQRYVKDLIKTTNPVSDLVPQREILNYLRDSEWVKNKEVNFYSDTDMLITLALFGLDVWRLGAQGYIPEVGKKSLKKLLGKEVTNIIYDFQRKLDSNLIFTKVDFNIVLAMAEKYVSLKSYDFNYKHEKLLNFIFKELGAFEPSLEGNKQKIAEDKRILERILKCAQQAACSRNAYFIRAAIGFCEIFIKNNHATLQVLEIIREMGKQGLLGSGDMLKLCGQLVSLHGLGQEEALRCAQQCIINGRSQYRCDDLLTLLNLLIDRSFGLEEIAVIAQNAARDNAYDTQRIMGALLFIKLMSKNLAVDQAIEAYLCLMGWYNQGLYQHEKDFLRDKFWPSLFSCIGMQNDETLNRDYFEIFYAKFKEFYENNKQNASIQEPIKIIIDDMKKSQSGYVQETMKQLEQPEQRESDEWSCVIS